MSKCLICMFSYNRYPHLKMCLGHLLASFNGDNCSVVVFDDGSSDVRVRNYLHDLPIKERNSVSVNMKEPSQEPKGMEDAASRIGEQRRLAINHFLDTDFDYVLLIDDDVITNYNAVMDVVNDFDFLRTTDYLNPGAISMHGQLGTDAFINVNGKIFSSMHLTGEAHIMFPRDVLFEVGNRFGPGGREFADKQLRAIMSARYDYLERTYPAYEVQHIGFGEHGSVVHEGRKKPPVWNTGPYRNNWKHNQGKPLTVSSFDLRRYCVCVQKYGGKEAPLYYTGEKSDGE